VSDLVDRAVVVFDAQGRRLRSIGREGRGPGEFAALRSIGLLGDTLYAPALPETLRTRYERRLAEARRDFDQAPNEISNIIWLGRRTAYLGRFRDAIAIFSTGLQNHPDDARLFRHRGHRYITLRIFNLAVSDLEHAASLMAKRDDETEPDGLPNARNIPTGTLKFNIWYHLGLAHYLAGDFPGELYWKIPLSYCLPFLVATWGALINTRVRTQ